MKRTAGVSGPQRFVEMIIAGPGEMREQIPTQGSRKTQVTMAVTAALPVVWEGIGQRSQARDSFGSRL